MTPEELKADRAKREAYVDAMGFPEIRGPSAESMALDAPDEVIISEFARLLKDDIQASKVMHQIILHRRELGLDGGIQENPYFPEMVKKFASMGINFDPYNPEAIHAIPGWREAQKAKREAEEGDGQEEKGSKSG